MKKLAIIMVSFGLIVPVVSFAVKNKVVHHKSEIVVGKKMQKIINVNIAKADDLASLKGLGVKKAQAIIDYRNKQGKFSSIDDLKQVNGIGDKIISRIQKYNPGKLIVE